MKFDNAIAISKVLELYETFEYDVRKNWYINDCCLIFNTIKKDKYQIQIQIELKDYEPFEKGVNSNINLYVENGTITGKSHIDNSKIESIESLESILVDIADKELEILYN